MTIMAVTGTREDYKEHLLHVSRAEGLNTEENKYAC